ncbi:MAG TPA: LON peptidase substrate-binding domain-containing protein, partial [Xanthomonadales bacterium]|nr:LON peptidase substrate-binding domain-containing protein [Xanthomonadales bacterium]
MTETAKNKPEPGKAQQPTPVLSLRDVVVYPYMVIPLFVGRERSILALDRAMDVDKRIVLVTQRSADVDEPSEGDLFEVGTLATVLQLLKLPDGTTKVLVEGGERVRINKYKLESGYFEAHWELIPTEEEASEQELEVTMRSLVSLFEQYVKLNRKIPPELLTTLAGIEDASRLADTVAAHMAIRLEEKQVLLEMGSPRRRMEHLMALVEGEIDVLQLEKRIRGRVKTQMEKSQREYYLNEQMKAIQKELGDMDDAPNDLDDLARRIDESGMSEEAEKKANSELNKLRMMSPMSAEATVVRNYIDWMLNVPWKKRSRIRKKLDEAEAILEADHYGLEKVKERILEYLAVQQRVRKMKGP